ncbi:adenosylcobinamide-GDP ribazoletransferase [Chloroflexota bacterium]
MATSNNSKPSIPILTPALVALQFLSVMPPVIRRAFTDEELGAAVGYFPFVGLVIGAGITGSFFLLSAYLPTSIVVALVLGLWVLLTGALHVDGFLDTCDGLFGGRSPEQRLEIMRDERLGAYAFAGGFFLLTTKYMALIETISVRTLLLVPMISRWAVSFALVAFPYAREIGLGRTMKDQASWGQIVLTTLLTLIASWWLMPMAGLFLMAISAVVMLACGWFVCRKIPGLTGDVYGAICEMCEVVMLVILASEVL